MKIIAKILIIFAGTLAINGGLYSQSKINKIFFDKKDVFDSTQKDWFFAAKLANSFHSLTRDYIIEDELLFKEGDTLNLDLIDETERNIRKTQLFIKVKIELDSVAPGLYDVYVVTQDKWSLKPAVAFGSGGGSTRLGAQVEESNLFGTGTEIFLNGMHRNESDIGMQAMAHLIKERIFRSDFDFLGSILAHKYRTEEYASLTNPYRTYTDPWAMGIGATNNFGRDLLYKDGATDFDLMKFHDRSISGWTSWSLNRIDQMYFSLYGSWEDVNRGAPRPTDPVKSFARAFDNSGQFLMTFSSLSQDFVKVDRLEGWYTEDMPIGGWGSVVLGKTFPIAHRGELLYYVGGEAEKSYLSQNGKAYLFLNINGGSGIKDGMAKNTYQEFNALSFYRFDKSSLLCLRIKQQTAWNWPDLRQLILDNDAGLRGYKVNALSGDSRYVGNIEWRLFPDWQFWIAKFGADIFYDAGAAWNQDKKIYQARLHNALGVGLRMFNLKNVGDKAVFRFDFAYNFDEKKIGFVFSTDQLFKAFGDHKYKPPTIYGLDFDEE